jgi:exonuclease VII small subunit
VALLRKCQATLTAAEQQIRILDADGLREFDAPQGIAPGGLGDGKQEA